LVSRAAVLRLVVFKKAAVKLVRAAARSDVYIPDRLLANSAEAMPLVTLTSDIASVLTPLIRFQFWYRLKAGYSESPEASVPSTVKLKPVDGSPLSETPPEVAAPVTIPVPRFMRLVQSRRGSGNSRTWVVEMVCCCSEFAVSRIGAVA